MSKKQRTPQKNNKKPHINQKRNPNETKNAPKQNRKKNTEQQVSTKRSLTKAKTALSKYFPNCDELMEGFEPPDYLNILNSLDEKDFFYTDWKDYNREEAKKSGIVGPDRIKQEIQIFAEKNNLKF